MAVFLFVTTWLLLATSLEVSGRGDVLIANVQTNSSSDPLVGSADTSSSSNSTDTAGKNSNLTTSEIETASGGNQSVSEVVTESKSSTNGAQETPGTSGLSEVSGKPIVNVPNPIGIGAVDASNSTSGAPADEIVSTIIQDPAGRESQPPAKNATEKPAAGTNEVMKPAETSAATVDKGPPINEINESIKTTSVKSVSISLPTSTTVRPTTTTSVVSGPTASGDAASASENNPSTSPSGSSIAERNQNSNASTGGDVVVSEPENKPSSTGSAATANTDPAIAEPSEGASNSTTPSGGEGTNNPTGQSTTKEAATSGNTPAKQEVIAVTSEGSTKTDGSQKSGSTAVEATNENKTNVAEAGTPDSSNATTGSNTSPAQTIPSSPGSEQTIPSDSGNSNATEQTILERSGNSNSNLSEPNGTVQTIPASSKNSSTIQTIPTPPKEPLTNPTTIVGDPTFVGISENSTGGINGTMVDLGNSTISNATTLVPPLVPTKGELLKRRIEKDTVSIRKNLEKRAAYYKRTEARMTSLLQTIKKRNQLTQTALKHLPELLSALITEPTQRIKLSQLFAAANALQAITSEVGVEAASNVTTVVSPSEAVRVSNATAI